MKATCVHEYLRSGGSYVHLFSYLFTSPWFQLLILLRYNSSTMSTVLLRYPSLKNIDAVHRHWHYHGLYKILINTSTLLHCLVWESLVGDSQTTWAVGLQCKLILIWLWRSKRCNSLSCLDSYSSEQDYKPHKMIIQFRKQSTYFLDIVYFL